MIRADENGRVAPFGLADEVRAVTASIVEDVDPAVVVRTMMTGCSPICRRTKSPGLRNFGFVSDIDPDFVPDIGELPLEDVLAAVEAP